MFICTERFYSAHRAVKWRGHSSFPQLKLLIKTKCSNKTSHNIKDHFLINLSCDLSVWRGLGLDMWSNCDQHNEEDCLYIRLSFHWSGTFSARFRDQTPAFGICAATTCYVIEILNSWSGVFKYLTKVKWSSPEKVAVHLGCILKFCSKAGLL